MTVACEVVDIVYTAAFCLLWILLCWQSQRRWLRIPVRSTERLYVPEPAPGKRARPKWFPAFGWHDARDLYSSYLFPKHGPFFLMLVNAIVCAGVVLATIFEFVGDSELAPYADYGAYLTNWTFYLLGFRALYGFFVCLDGQRHLHNEKSAIRSGDSDGGKPRPYNVGHVIYAILTAIMPTVALCVAVGYWAAIRSPGDFKWDQPVKHGANAAVLIFELLVSRLPMTSTWMVFPLLYTTIYTEFMIIYWAIDGTWVYRRTDIQECPNLISYIFAPWIVLIAFWLLYGLTLLRNHVSRRVTSRPVKQPKQDIEMGRSSSSSHSSATACNSPGPLSPRRPAAQVSPR